MIDEPLTSTSNPRVKSVTALQRSRTRREEGRYLVEGPNAVTEALGDGVVESLYATADLIGDYRGLDGVEVIEVAEHVLDKMADSRSPQGVVAVARIPWAALSEVIGRGVLVVCESISDPGNAGNIIRTADAAGAAGVVFTAGSVDPFNPKAVRAATGSTTHLPIVTGVDLDEVAASCRAAGQPLLGLDAGGSREVFSLESRPGAVALLFGNEAHGLSAEARSVCDDVVSIPLYGRAESLNLATAVAITVYAAARARPTA